MWVYEKTLQYPVNLKCRDLRMAKVIMAQLGGPNGELAAALRYLQQRYTMPTGKSKGLLTDIGTEELAHVEIISSMIYQLTDGATPEEWTLTMLNLVMVFNQQIQMEFLLQLLI